MQKNKKEKGITLIILVLTIIVLGLITVPIVIRTIDLSDLNDFTAFKDDLTNLKETMNIALRNHDISSVATRYGGSTDFLLEEQYAGNELVDVRNPNDDDIYYVIDISKLNNVLSEEYNIECDQLNYGENNYNIYSWESVVSRTDVYIINNQSKTIYYPDGYTFQGKTYYRYPEKFSEVTDISSRRTWSPSRGVNKPVLKKGMKPVKFDKTSGTDDEPVEIVETTENDEEWYDYENQKWANAQTDDGSLWVWIPRFAYKIPSANYQTNTAGTIEIHFLIGTTDNYYDDNNELQQACRCDDDDHEENDSDYYNTSQKVVVHPAFANETAISYRNGGWDSELTGIWVAKFEAGFANAISTGTETIGDTKVKSADNKNTAEIKASKVKYTQSSTNWYGSYTADTTAINYPTFQGSTYSFNYISINDIYNICRAMTETESGYENIYHLGSDTDSHLMKNSEWGATAYLSQSKYGYKGANPSATDILVNSMTKGNSPSTIYAVTGYNNESTQKEWNKGGQGASTTQNVYGIYDMSGGLWEYSPSYIANGTPNLKNQGVSLTYKKVNNDDVLITESTKYITVYPYSNPESSTQSTASGANYGVNTKIYGDGVRETSNAGTGSASWNGDYSLFPATTGPFFGRGSGWDTRYFAGLFFFSSYAGISHYGGGFRAVLV